MVRYGMLQCKANFSLGKTDKSCSFCESLDVENHRINHWILYRNVNLNDSSYKLDFNLIYLDELDTSLSVADVIV